MSEPITWYDFDDVNARGRIGVQRDTYGVVLYLDDDWYCIGAVDLFNRVKDNATFIRPKVPHAMLLVYDPDNHDDVAYIVRFLQKGPVLEKCGTPLAKEDEHDDE